MKSIGMDVGILTAHLIDSGNSKLEPWSSSSSGLSFEFCSDMGLFN